MEDHDWGSIDFSTWTLVECCAWLLFILETDKFASRAYCAPFSRYVLTWHLAVPLNAIIIGQNPYPNDIFPEVAAAMSYSSTLSRECKNISGDVPPTVKVLANDLFVNAGLDREDTISIIRDGWALSEKGILLVNNSAFHDWRSPQGYKECVNQTTVIIQLLRETEKHGSRTVQLFVLGDAAQRMASNICSWYKSSTVKISKKSVTHPAALSRRFDDLYSPECHLGNSKFSVALAELLRNHVAFVHTMSKQGGKNPALLRQLDSLGHLADNLPNHQQAIDAVARAAKEVAEMDPSDSASFRAAAKKLSETMSVLSSRTALLSSMFSTAYSSTQKVAGVVSRAAPHEATIAPQSVPEIPPPRLSSVAVSFRKRSAAPSETGDSVATGVSTSSELPAAADASAALTPSSVSTVQFRSRVTSSTSVRSEAMSSHSTLAPVTFRKKPNKSVPNTTSAKSENIEGPFHSKISETSGNTESPLKMSKAQVAQLSCIESILEMLAPEALEKEDPAETLELIKHDIQNKVKYNVATQELCDAADLDLEKNAKFDLALYALEGGHTAGGSAMLDKCKELFEF